MDMKLSGSKKVYKIMFVQVRRADDPIADQEIEGFRSKLGKEESFEIEVRNALYNPLPKDQILNYDAVIVGGSGDMSVIDSASNKWLVDLLELVREVIRLKVPALGICFGHQVLALALGGAVTTQKEKAEMGTIEFSLTDAGKDFKLFEGMGEKFKAHTGHTDYVVAIPEDVDVLVSNGMIAAQAFKVRNAPFFSTQFHPDITAQEARDRINMYRDKIMARAEEKDGIDIADLFLPDGNNASLIVQNFGSMVKGHYSRA